MTEKAMVKSGNGINAELMEQVVVGGDLSKLSPQQRVEYYGAVCRSVGLNPLTRPFDYIYLNKKLTLYAKKDATDQLRSINGISIDSLETDTDGDLFIAKVHARDNEGRTDSDVGVVNIGNAKGDNKANAIMKAVTKAKRRVTLSICGLGWLDESEIETISRSAVRRVDVDKETGEIIEGEVEEPDPLAQAIDRVRKSGRNFFPALVDVTDWEQDDLKEAAKTLGMEKIHGDERRLAQFRTVHEYVSLVDEGIEGGLAIAVVNGALSHEEAMQQMEEIKVIEEEE